MKVLIISPCGLPIPAVKGGAVLTLMESLIIQNEKNDKLDFTVVGIHDEEAVKKASIYKRTIFIFLKEPLLCKILDILFEKVCEKLLHKTHKVLKRYAFKIYALWRFRKILIEQDFDRVVFQNAGYLLNVLKNKKISKKYQGKLYYHVHNDIPNNIYIRGIKQCKLLLISEYLEKKIVKMCGEEIRNQCYILKNGFDCSKYIQKYSEEERNQLKESIGIKEEEKVIMFAGRIDPTKGIEQLVTAYKEMNLEDTVLMVVGSHNFGSPQTSLFEQKMKKLFDDLGNKVKFTGYVLYKDMWKYYKVSDMAVLPSMWEEPAGLTVIEASAAEIPVITTKSGGIPEYLNEEYVILLDKDDYIVKNIENAIYTILNSPDEWKHKAEKASKYVRENFSEERFYFNFIELINC